MSTPKHQLKMTLFLIIPCQGETIAAFASAA